MGVTVSSLASVFNSFLSSWTKSEDVRILMLGLDSAGKTTILYKLKLGEVVSTIPTIGFNVETVEYQKLKLQVWDLGGQSSIRPYWRCYFPNTHGIIYVIDSSDRDRLTLARSELLTMLNEEELKGVPLLVFANKQDIDGALGSAEISDALDLTGGRESRAWTVQGTSAVKEEGLGNLQKGLEWLMSQIKNKD